MRYDKGGALSVARSAEAFLGVEPGGGFLGDLGRMYFPDRPPYVYTRNNLLSKLIPFYEEMVKHLIAGRN